MGRNARGFSRLNIDVRYRGVVERRFPADHLARFRCRAASVRSWQELCDLDR